MSRARTRLALFLLATSAAAHAELRLPAILSDHALLQAGKPIAIWGWATPAAHVTVSFNKAHATATADASGKWLLHLPAQKDNTEGALEVTSDRDAPLTVHDILTGQVWLGGGQSNMVYTIAGSTGIDRSNLAEVAEVNANIAAAKLEAAAARPPIRWFLVTSGPSAKPREDAQGKWLLADASNVSAISAVGWNFAVTVQNQTHLPLGLIISCVGGSPVQAWMSQQTLDSTSVGATVLARHAHDLAASTPEVIAKADADLAAWNATHTTPEQRESPRRPPPRHRLHATHCRSTRSSGGTAASPLSSPTPSAASSGSRPTATTPTRSNTPKCSAPSSASGAPSSAPALPTPRSPSTSSR